MKNNIVGAYVHGNDQATDIEVEDFLSLPHLRPSPLHGLVISSLFQLT
jgi:hypothetical protein